MDIAIMLCIGLGFSSLVFAWRIDGKDTDLQQVPLFISGAMLVLVGVGLFAGESVFRLLTGG